MNGNGQGNDWRRKLYYKLNSGKNSKLIYYTVSMARLAVPGWLIRPMLKGKLAAIGKRPDIDYILDRVNYYCKLAADTPFDRELWQREAVSLKDQQYTPQKVYYYDAMRYARWFDPKLRWVLTPGDISWNLQLPSIVKSRPVAEGNERSVLMKLNAIRHYIYTNDRKPWRDKKDVAVFRGGIVGERRLKIRKPFIERWFGHPMFDIGVINPEFAEWHTGKMTIKEHLDYKFVIALEGNDVASNLKWVMSSNSIAVMPRPQTETWYMEGRLIPNYHYIEIKPDYSDAAERLQHYIDHPDEAESIIRHQQEWLAQFRDRHRETLIALLVLDKYFKETNA